MMAASAPPSRPSAACASGLRQPRQTRPVAPSRLPTLPNISAFPPLRGNVPNVPNVPNTIYRAGKPPVCGFFRHVGGYIGYIPRGLPGLCRSGSTVDPRSSPVVHSGSTLLPPCGLMYPMYPTCPPNLPRRQTTSVRVFRHVGGYIGYIPRGLPGLCRYHNLRSPCLRLFPPPPLRPLRPVIRVGGMGRRSGSLGKPIPWRPRACRHCRRRQLFIFSLVFEKVVGVGAVGQPKNTAGIPPDWAIWTRLPAAPPALDQVRQCGPFSSHSAGSR